LLQQFLQELGITCLTYIPDRLQEGYGLKIPALQKLARSVKLLVTVDCGSSDAGEVAWAQEQGLEVIVTDHHELPPELPPALAVVNPKRGGEDYPFVELAGVGVALLLALGVRAHLRERGWFKKHSEPNLRAYLDLVALGTAADVAPMVGENRILVRQGLKVLEESRRPGLVALKEVAGLEGKPISYRDAIFRLAPRLNAAGRLGQSRGALELLMSDDMAQARTQTTPCLKLRYPWAMGCRTIRASRSSGSYLRRMLSQLFYSPTTDKLLEKNSLCSGSYTNQPRAPAR